MAEPSFAETMLAKYETLLQRNVGVTSVTVDGTVVGYADIEAAYMKWKRAVAREQGRRPTVAQIDLRNS